MTYQIEVCIDNIESLPLAIQGGATRIELCASLALGGLTPNAGLIKQAVQASSIPIYVMIRPRQGDFLYDHSDAEVMAEDIRISAQYGAQGIVLGMLDKEGNIDKPLATRLIALAHKLGLGVTFHRAFDQCSNPFQALEHVIELGCERILTSGLGKNVCEGMAMLKQLNEKANGRVAIMAGAGLNEKNVADVIATTKVTEVHLSGKSTRPSQMLFVASTAKMGQDDVDDFAIPITDPDKIRAVIEQLPNV
ncbi:copper homeostasis protein CutC [Vibrio sp. 10N.286.49.C2]|uniref:copper homeostasis protein CutC n=1 Tax=unclassified Vibrio TaxID=2614977 RepID=UPI000C8237BF|nr:MULTISPECIES: copper homeostasis protein CutC [unclassified Vibrio]PMH33336.1 copper homeostasis protein CutC [Vibrio sp. 10N.286.49.C2]PMH48233.1 copper homeostasis protein CutC [Vibrio sp. 10N.286.49.B1]PMH80407.1 copper homeostasis protein CutC [Vibrio sp. 10N.286.48.B7]